MEKIMTNGFCELNEQEMMEVDGGVDPILGAVIVGVVGAAVLVGVGSLIVGQVNRINTKGGEAVANATDPSAYYNHDSDGDGASDCYRYYTYTWSGPQTHYVQ